MIVFDARNIISYEKFHFFIAVTKLKFQQKRNDIFEKYHFLEPLPWNSVAEDYRSFRNEYRALIYDVLKKTISFYRPFLPKNLFIACFGSFFKTTERILSDLDFTICYDEVKTPKYECAEEIIDYSISQILGFTIDHVHGNFQHYPQMHDFDSYTEKDNCYCLQFENDSVTYSCGPKTLQENLTNIKNVRDYKTLLTSFEIKYKEKKDIDSLYSILILENNTEHDFLYDLSKLEDQYDICDGYNFNLSVFKVKEKFCISDIKKMLKYGGIVEFYIFIAKLRKKIPLGKPYSMTIEEIWENKSFVQLLGLDYVCRLKNAYYAFLFYWNRIEYSLAKRNIALSTRCYKEFNILTMNEILYADWGKSTDMDVIISSKNNLSILIQEGLKLAF